MGTIHCGSGDSGVTAAFGTGQILYMKSTSVFSAGFEMRHHMRKWIGLESNESFSYTESDSVGSSSFSLWKWKFDTTGGFTVAYQLSSFVWAVSWTIRASTLTNQRITCDHIHRGFFVFISLYKGDEVVVLCGICRLTNRLDEKFTWIGFLQLSRKLALLPVYR